VGDTHANLSQLLDCIIAAIVGDTHANIFQLVVCITAAILVSSGIDMQTLLVRVHGCYFSDISIVYTSI